MNESGSLQGKSSNLFNLNAECITYADVYMTYSVKSIYLYSRAYNLYSTVYNL